MAIWKSGSYIKHMKSIKVDKVENGYILEFLIMKKDCPPEWKKKVFMSYIIMEEFVAMYFEGSILREK